MDAKVYFNLAMCCIVMRDYNKAATYLETCLKINPNLVKAKEKLGEIAEYQKKVQ
jgi:tetratricopeptide (TPR) repeat protein